RDLWTAIKTLAENITDEPWLILGDFNAVIDASEVCGRAADTTNSMNEFRNCILETGLIQLPFSGSPFTWHNCSEGPRSLWKRLDRMLVNAVWLNTWPDSSYISALPSTSDHSPLILNSVNRGNDHGLFRFDNYLAKRSGFLDSVRQVWRHRITGTVLYGVVVKLKALKATFRQQRKETGNLTENVRTAKRFLDKAQELFDTHKDDLLLQLVKCCRLVYSVAIKMEANMLKQRAKLQWLKQGDHTSKIFFRKNAFVPGRNISDNILLAQELLAGYNQARLPPRSTIKVDIQKAYDSVEWDFLFEVLKLFNFPARFIGWIEQCVTTVHFSISLNGSIYGYFPGARGLRQGDPMSPYLFVLVMEIWTTLLRHRVQNDPNFQFHWKCKEHRILSLCFADDVLLFCKAHIPSVQIIISKSGQNEKQQILNLLGFQEGSLPVKYLGVPLTSSRLTLADCSPLIHKVDCRLSGWSHLNLSFAGRALLIKSVLSTLHNYWASVFILPKGIIKLLESKLRKFLWQGSTGKGYAKVAWDLICKPKEEGGLDFRSIETVNRALMLKHLWRLVKNDGSSIWVDWITHFRLKKSTLWTFDSKAGSWGWKKMIKLRFLLKNALHYKVGNGNTFSLWQDIWHERGPLCLTYPNGPTITGLPLDSLINCVLQQDRWNWPSTTNVEINDIISRLPQTYPNEEDTIIWRNASGRFSIQAIVEIIQPHSPKVSWYLLLQGKYKIPRHRFILWLAILEKLSTMDKPWSSHTATGCLFCDGMFAETHDHLFFNCGYTRRCLALIQRKIRFQWPYTEWQKGIRWASKKWRGTHLVNAASRAVLAALVYHLWLERNKRKFNATASSAESIAARILEEVRMRILSEDFIPSLQSRSLYRIWKIAWPMGQA
ncbi:UNVERIFIED_CONTAM: Retrovirus-related Pol polyprotein from type-2 retrotransposable element R2DM, partial [Sesamum calycinum]